MQDFPRDGGADAHTAEGDAPRPGSVVDVSIVPDIASNATKPVVLNPICVRSARSSPTKPAAVAHQARSSLAPLGFRGSAHRGCLRCAQLFLRDGERAKRAS